MSQLSQSLEKRIQELTKSIEAQRIELAAYQHVLQMETSKSSVAPDAQSEVANHESTPSKRGRKPGASLKSSEAPSIDPASIPVTPNKTLLVAEIVKSHGPSGATPKDVDAVFNARKVERSKNLIYNTLSYLVAQKKLHRRNGKYYAAGTRGSLPKKAVSKSAAPTKRRLSPEGLKRIKEALKKRWAAKRAADSATALAAKQKSYLSSDLARNGSPFSP